MLEKNDCLFFNPEFIISFVKFSSITAISKEEADDVTNRGHLPYNGYSEEFLDRLEPNGNIPADKDRRYGMIDSY